MDLEFVSFFPGIAEEKIANCFNIFNNFRKNTIFNSTIISSAIISSLKVTPKLYMKVTYGKILTHSKVCNNV